MNFRQRTLVCTALAAAVTSPLFAGAAAHALTPTPQVVTADTKSTSEVLAAGKNADAFAKELNTQVNGRHITQVTQYGSAIALTDDGSLLAAKPKGGPDMELLDKAEGKHITRVAGTYYLEAISQYGQSVLRGNDLAGHKAVDVSTGFSPFTGGRAYYVTDRGILLRELVRVGGTPEVVAQDIAQVAATSNHGDSSAYVAVNSQGDLVGDASGVVAQLAQAAHGQRITRLTSDGTNSVYALTSSNMLIGASGVGDDAAKLTQEITQQAAGRKIVQISASQASVHDHLLALTEDGTVLAAGEDGDGQVSGLLEQTNGRHVTAIGSGPNTNFAIADKADEPDHHDEKLEERHAEFWLHNAVGEVGQTKITMTDEATGNTATAAVDHEPARVTLPQGVKEMTLKVELAENWSGGKVLGHATVQLTRDVDGHATVIDVISQDGTLTFQHDEGETFTVTAKPKS
ncbi:RCC1 domain-containing protein [Streptomyces sp. NPDC050848]|uniref:RCC1-like domain-containing protein n=1 Tax=Streptomyces sp. NPDC050848 TaxID=3155791 RepID=UPI0033EC2A51